MGVLTDALPLAILASSFFDDCLAFLHHEMLQISATFS